MMPGSSRMAMLQVFLAPAMALWSALGMALAMTLVPAPAAHAQPGFPSRPLKLIVPYPPGGSSDTLGRLVGGKLAERLGQPVVVENRPGASGVIGAQALMEAPADGHTLLLVVNSHAVNSSIIAKLPYDPVRDFAPVATFASTPFLLAVHPSLPASNLAEFVALARSRNGGLAYGTVGSAGIGRVAGELFAEVSGAPLRHVPYKGSAPLLTDLLAGHVDFVIDTPIVYLSQIDSGKVRPLAVSGRERLPNLPSVPTFAQAGFERFQLAFWFGLLTRAGAPGEVVERLAAEVGRIVALPDVRDKLAAQAFEPFFNGPAQFAGLIAAETERYARIVRAAGIKPE